MNKYLIFCVLIILNILGCITYFLKKRISNYNEKSDKVKVICYSTHPDQYYDDLVESARKFNYELVTLGMGTKWKGFGDKLLGYYNFVKNYENKEEVILFVDAYDVLLCRDSKDIIATYKENYDKVVFNCEIDSYNPSTILIRNLQYNPGKLPYCGDNCSSCKYINSGVFIGKVKDIENILHNLVNYSTFSNNTDDQRILNKLYSKGIIDIDIDWKGVLFGVLSMETDNIFFKQITQKHNQIYNPHTKTYPYVLHGPGKSTSLDSYKKSLNLNGEYYKGNTNYIPTLLFILEYIFYVGLLIMIILFLYKVKMSLFLKILIVITVILNLFGLTCFISNAVMKIFHIRNKS